MDRRVKNQSSECWYKENDGHLKEQLINGLSEDIVTTEIIKEYNDD